MNDRDYTVGTLHLRLETDTIPEEKNDDTKGIFYAPDDDEPQEVTDTEEMERKLQAIAEYEKRNFGTPAFDHDGDVRLPAIDDNGEWEVMADARVIGEDHRVDEGILEAILDEGRIEIVPNSTKEIHPEEVASPRPGGVLGPDFYPREDVPVIITHH